MKKVLFISLGVIGVVALAGFIFIKVKSEPMPTIVEGDGDEIAQKMLVSLDAASYENIDFLHWNFKGFREYTWDKNSNLVIVSWKDIRVHLDLDKVRGRSYKSGKETGKLYNSWLVRKAWKFWCNDSFWLLAPYKVFDPGTKRHVATLQDGTQGLLVQYESGGITPGDSYFWILDEAYKPKAFKMWVSIVPVKGIMATWDDWQTTESGAQFSTKHNLPYFVSRNSDVKEGQSWGDFGFIRNPEFP